MGLKKCLQNNKKARDEETAPIPEQNLKIFFYVAFAWLVIGSTINTAARLMGP